MKHTRTTGLIFILLAFQFSARAQGHLWTLSECLDYAREHNIGVQRERLKVEEGDVRLNSSKSERLPEVNAVAGEVFSFGNYYSTTGRMEPNPYSGNNNLTYTSGQIEMDVPIFEGLRITNQIKADESALNAVRADLELLEKNLDIKVAGKFLECLYYKGMVEVADSQVKTSTLLVEKAEALVSEGSRPKSEYAEAESQLMSDKYSLTDAEGQYKLKLLDLRKAMNIPPDEEFEIADIDGLPEVPSMIPEEAVEYWPSITAAKARIDQANSLVKVARSKFYPSLSFTAAISTYYVKMFQSDFAFSNFGHQFFSENPNEVLGLSLKIPIFNRFSTRNNVKLAELKVRDMHLELADSKQSISLEMQDAYTKTRVAYDKYLASDRAVEAAKIAMDYAFDSYDAGKGSVYDYQQSRQKYISACNNLLQAKYSYLIYNRILELYRSGSN